jgi:thermolysin
VRGGLAVAALVGFAIVMRGQTRVPELRSIQAAGATLSARTTRVDGMLRDGTLGIGRVQADTMLPGRTHERLAQQYEGLPVFGGEIIRQMNRGVVLTVFGATFENVSLPTIVPALDGPAAREAAEAAVGDGAIAGEPQLGILPADDRYVLAYTMTVRSRSNIEIVFVNAATGAVEKRLSRIRFQQDQPSVGLGTGVLNDHKKVSADLFSGTYHAVDILRPSTGFTLDFHGSASRLNTFLQTGRVTTSDIATSTSTSWTDGSVVDAHVYQGWVYDYYYKRFGRHGLDDHDLDIIGIVHPLARSDASLYTPSTVGNYINNAAYIGDGFMLYGDGDGRQFDYFAGGLDVIAHELSHGVTDYTSQLEYQNESGALNEAFSDIMGTSVEYYFEKPGQGPQKGPNFLIGEDITKTAPGFVRSLQNPIAGGTPDHYSLRQFIGTATDNGGVHVNSTIVSHAFYLAIAGGTNRVSGISVTGIGLANMERMERIFYRAFVFYLGPRAVFAEARQATLQAATDLYGVNSNERAQLAAAWTAVGVQ